MWTVDDLPYLRALTIAVTGMADTTPPEIYSADEVAVDSGAPLSHTLIANETPVTWSISGGADQALFGLSGNTLTMSPQDYNEPSDADANNIYIVEVTARDASSNATGQTISVRVNQVAQPHKPTRSSGWI